MKFLVVAGIIFLVQNVMGQDARPECVPDFPLPCKEPNKTSQLISIANGCPVYGCVPNQAKCCRTEEAYKMFCEKGQVLVERWDDDGCLRKTCIPEQPKCCRDPINQCEPEKTYSVKVYKEDGCYYYACVPCPEFREEDRYDDCCPNGYNCDQHDEKGCRVWGCCSWLRAEL